MEFCLLLKNIGKYIGKNISKTLSGKRNQNLPDHTKKSATDALKTASKRTTADKITKVSRTSPQNNLETVKNAHNKEIPKERYISPVEWQKIIDDLWLI